MIIICQFRNQISNCGKLFKKTLTDDGFCYSFNIFSNMQLFKQNEYRYEENLDESSQWTRETGYKVDPKINDYPYRALANFNYGLNIVLALKLSDLDYICKGPVSCFKIHLHTPDTIPNMRNGFFRLPLKRDA
ncbi:hypothetical protein PVAND_000002 [Polypedilum vanderplanki]|uniref:Uncharacterized protein n=1 Tax=Polypedilum vanderplanki TaxID=319348 RepID=A0A9J6BJ15_POLVA|nr:hypothetical protein PVAND_000002 [Polypedilum vanderplanki]